MHLNKVIINNFRVFKDVEISFDRNEYSKVFPISSINGGGKSTLLQMIFTLLNCMGEPNKYKYIINLFDTGKYKIERHIDLVSFELEYKNNNIDIAYHLLPLYSKEFDFTVIEKIDSLDKSLQKFKSQLTLIENLINHTDYKSIDQYKSKIENMLMKIDRDDIIIQIENTFRHLGFQKYNIKVNEIISELLNDTKIKIKEYNDKLEECKLQYFKIKEKLNLEDYHIIGRLSSDNEIILLKSKASAKILNEIADNVYLNGPSSQVYLFMNKKQKESILKFDTKSNEDFNEINDILYKYSNNRNRYSNYLDEVKLELQNFNTYDFVSKDIINQAINIAFRNDIETKTKTGEYGNDRDLLTKKLYDFFDDKYILWDAELSKIRIMIKGTDEEILPEDLSHGELKKLSLYIWLSHVIKDDGIVLLDEIDIALHPAWLYNITKELQNWNSHTQILLATHSPQIVSSTYYKNIIKIEKKDGVANTIPLTSPPSDRDINAIVKTIMDSPDFPIELLELHKEYRRLFEEGKIDTPEAKKLRKKILEHESEGSSFFQEIDFELGLL